ncbi:protein mono-ADP-ribosyltransferase PARP10 [Oenanthe melanoleuca]|uniref:protein mono-ADP-ribosyltransferase PARP10 n=1 Tax=Oenanthe melanoleuca TaxID=2939378 RepID=UPI0024C10893|nr:protein mono-ADP-ribosyltransferase PARP10 [Oenanthe melanoleuca]
MTGPEPRPIYGSSDPNPRALPRGGGRSLETPTAPAGSRSAPPPPHRYPPSPHRAPRAADCGSGERRSEPRSAAAPGPPQPPPCRSQPPRRAPGPPSPPNPPSPAHRAGRAARELLTCPRVPCPVSRVPCPHPGPAPRPPLPVLGPVSVSVLARGGAARRPDGRGGAGGAGGAPRRPRGAADPVLREPAALGGRPRAGLPAPRAPPLPHLRGPPRRTERAGPGQPQARGGGAGGAPGPPPWDPTHLLLHSLEPRSPPEPLDVPLDTLLGVPPGSATLCQGSVPGGGLLRLRDPLSPPELAAAERRARQRGLALLRVPRSSAVLVRAPGPAPSRDLLELYFENRRSGGGRVTDVRPLPGGRGAVVTFQEAAAAERVLQRTHRLQDTVLELVPHFPFLELPLDADVEPLLVTEPSLDMECLPDTAPGVAQTKTPPDTAPGVAHTNTLLDTASGAVHTNTQPDTAPGVAHMNTQPDTAPGVTQTNTQPDTAPGVAHMNTQPDTAPGVAHTNPQLDTAPGVAQTNIQLDTAPGVAHTNTLLDTAPGVAHTNTQLDTAPGVVHTNTQLDTAPGVAHTNTQLDTAPGVVHTNTPPDTVPSPTWHPVPEQPPAAVPSRDKDTAGLRAVPSQAQHPGPVSVGVPEPVSAVPVSAVPVQDEVLVPAEPGALRYLQQHHQDVLSSIPEVSLLPLEGGDISAFRVSGEPERCQAVAEFLQSLLDSVCSHPTTLRLPGVARFLWDLAGQSLLQQLESRFQCVIQLEGEPWSPPDPQLELEELLPPSRDLPEDADGDDDGDDDGGNDDGFHSNAEEIKEVMAALHPGSAGGRGSPELWPGTVPDAAWDAGDETPSAGGGDGAKELLSHTRVEEEVQMALAIQCSMDDSWCEEQELARATALSLRSFSRERRQERAQEDAGLLAALEASLEEALRAADVARATVFCSPEQEAAAVPRELGRALAGRQREREVASERLRALPAAGCCALALLRRRHAVHLLLRGGTATLRGFADYLGPAAQELTALLQRLPPPGHAAAAATSATATTTKATATAATANATTTIIATNATTAATTAATAATAAATAHWVRWDPCGTAVPYAPETAALLEQAWQRRERRLDLVLDGRPLTVDLERMEEFDLGSARALPVCRSQPPLDSTCCLLGPEVPGLEEEVRLLALAEDSEEFADTVQHFSATLEELHGHISVVQVQKLIHPVLYKQYQLKKGSVGRACAAGTAVERVLFHGTTQASSREICLHGFNRSFCGKNATLYGLGVYFAARAAVSARDRYSPPGAAGTKFIFMAKVLTGEFTAGRPGLRAPPLREGAGVPRRFHSVVDDPRRPEIFVIFNDTQAYPQYLITCRSRRGGPL